MPDIQHKPSINTANVTSAAPKPGGKQALIIKLMRRKKGATIAELATATGWQAHSVRGAISAAVKRKYGFAVTTTQEGDRGRVYRIATEG